MIYYMSRKSFMSKQHYTIKNSNGQTIYECTGSFYKVPKKYSVSNYSAEVVAIAENIPLSGNPRFTLNLGNEEFDLKESFGTFKCESLGWHIEEYSLGHEIQIISGSKTIATVHKKWFSWGGRFEIDVAKEDLVVTVALIILCIQYTRYSNTILGVLANW